jgi:hypothetical protein
MLTHAQVEAEFELRTVMAQAIAQNELTEMLLKNALPSAIVKLSVACVRLCRHRLSSFVDNAHHVAISSCSHSCRSLCSTTR